MLAWALLLIVSAVYLHALDPLPTHARGWQRFWKGIGIVLLLVGAALLLGALAGSRDPLQPLSVLRNALPSGEARPLPFTRIRSLDDLAARVKTSNRPVLLDFYADWCVTCKEMERGTFADPRVRAELAAWTLLQADVTLNSDEDKALLRRFKVFGPPAIVFFDRSGNEIEGVRVTGLQEADEFLSLLVSLR
jgi:thiol:disulfide interchange protein DsbD